jgi:hypothetical protein
MMIRMLLLTVCVNACSPLVNLDETDESNLTNPCEPGAEDRGAADCTLGFWCNPQTSICEKGDIYLPVYKIMPPSYEGTCFESDVSTCFDGRGSCVIKHRELKDDQVEVRDGDIYEVRWENGAACYYMSVLFAGRWDWPDIFERSWCVNSDPLGNQMCFHNEISSITANTQAEYSVGAHAEGSSQTFEFRPRGDLYNNHCNWRLACPGGNDQENWATLPILDPPWTRSETNARINLFSEAVTNYCDLAKDTPLREWPIDGNVVPQVPIAEADRFPGDITEGEDENMTWSGLAVPAEGVSEVVRIERLVLKRTNTLPKVIDGALELQLVHAGDNTTGNVRGMLANKDQLILHLGGRLWKDSHCSPKLILDLDGWRASNFEKIPTVIEGCGLDSTLFLCSGARQDCRAN